ncbi:MAG: bacterial transcriptional activator domain-containing protein [Nitrospira sp.]|nr:bacterial transcriptional activator domain-containing protein [Nitrospira sp.]
MKDRWQIALDTAQGSSSAAGSLDHDRCQWEPRRAGATHHRCALAGGRGRYGLRELQEIDPSLRKLIGVDKALQWQDGKVSLNQDVCWQDVCWIDVEVFDQLAIRQDDRARALYIGPFLGREALPVWAEFRRAQTRSRWLRLINRHCDKVLIAGNDEEAIRLLERAIDVDPVVEALYRRLILLLVLQARLAEARQYYRLCVKAHGQWGEGSLSPDTLRLGRDLDL